MNGKVGIVTQLDPAGARVRVRFPDEDAKTDIAEPGLETYWLQVLHSWTHATKLFSMPALGEQVVCLMDENLEFGVVLGGVYSAADTRPTAPDKSVHLQFTDGTILEYDPTGHVLKADIKGTLDAKTTGAATLEAGGTATVKAPGITLDGPVHVTGALTVDAASTLKGAVTCQSTVDATGKISTADAVDTVVGTQKGGVSYNFP